MNKEKLEMACEWFIFHTNILARGFLRSLHGTIVAVLLVVAAHGFHAISAEAGYTAVVEFVASCGLLVIALCNMYQLGKKRGARR